MGRGSYAKKSIGSEQYPRKNGLLGKGGIFEKMFIHGLAALRNAMAARRPA
jgi:hypothetical protein